MYLIDVGGIDGCREESESNGATARWRERVTVEGEDRGWLAMFRVDESFGLGIAVGRDGPAGHCREKNARLLGEERVREGCGNLCMGGWEVVPKGC